MSEQFKWLTLKTASERYQVSTYKILKVLEAGGIPSAVRIGCHWYIPADLDYAIFNKKRFKNQGPSPKTPLPSVLMEDYMAIGTIDGVGQKYGVTRERVRQILRKNFGDYTDFKPLQEHIKCTVCGEKKPNNRHNSKYCSNECRYEAIRLKWEKPERVCTVCKIPKAHSEFPPNGRQLRNHSICKDCKCSMNKATYRLRKAGLLPIEREGDGKNCTKCGKWKKWDLFLPNFVNKDGKTSWCRGCMNEYGKKWQKTNQGAGAKRGVVDDKSLGGDEGLE